MWGIEQVKQFRWGSKVRKQEEKKKQFSGKKKTEDKEFKQCQRVEFETVLDWSTEKNFFKARWAVMCSLSDGEC